MSKPILSELEYNADDVASAILSKADLSITNSIKLSNSDDYLQLKMNLPRHSMKLMKIKIQ